MNVLKAKLRAPTGVIKAKWKAKKQHGKEQENLDKLHLPSEYSVIFNMAKNKQATTKDEVMQLWYDKFPPVFKKNNTTETNTKKGFKNKCYSDCDICFMDGCKNSAVFYDLSEWEIYEKNKNVSTDRVIEDGKVIKINLHLCRIHLPNTLFPEGKEEYELIQHRKDKRRAWGDFVQFENSFKNKKKEEIKIHKADIYNKNRHKLIEYDNILSNYRNTYSSLKQMLRWEEANRRILKSKKREIVQQKKDYLAIKNITTLLLKDKEEPQAGRQIQIHVGKRQPALEDRDPQYRLGDRDPQYRLGDRNPQYRLGDRDPQLLLKFGKMEKEQIDDRNEAQRLVNERNLKRSTEEAARKSIAKILNMSPAVGTTTLYRALVDHVNLGDASERQWWVKMVRLSKKDVIYRELSKETIDLIHNWAKQSDPQAQQGATIMKKMPAEEKNGIKKHEPKVTTKKQAEKIEKDLNAEEKKERTVINKLQMANINNTNNEKVVSAIGKLYQGNLKDLLLTAYSNKNKNNVLSLINQYYRQSSIVAIKEGLKGIKYDIGISNANIMKLWLKKMKYGRRIYYEMGKRWSEKGKINKLVKYEGKKKKIELTNLYDKQVDDQHAATDCLLYLTGRKKGYGIADKIKMGLHRRGQEARFALGLRSDDGDFYKQGLIMSSIMLAIASYAIVDSARSGGQSLDGVIKMIEDDFVQKFTEEAIGKIGTIQNPNGVQSIIVPYYITANNPWVCDKKTKLTDVTLVEIKKSYGNGHMHDIVSQNQLYIVCTGGLDIPKLKAVKKAGYGIADIVYCRDKVNIIEHPGNFDYKRLSELYFDDNVINKYIGYCSKEVSLTLPEEWACLQTATDTDTGPQPVPFIIEGCEPPTGIVSCIMFVVFFKKNVGNTLSPELGRLHDLLYSVFSYFGEFFIGNGKSKDTYFFDNTLDPESIWVHELAEGGYDPQLVTLTDLSCILRQGKPPEDESEHDKLERIARDQFCNRTNPFAKWLLGPHYNQANACYVITNLLLLSRGYDILTMEMLGLGPFS